MMIPGTFPALPTPFAAGKVDLPALRKLIRHVLDNGCEGVLACGTTGEAPTLDADEWKAVVETTVDEAGEKPVLVGTGTNNTKAAAQRTVLAREIGAAAALVVVPYYNKPMQRGLLEHFRVIAKTAKLPMILYNIPGRSGRNMEPQTVVKLSRLDEVVGIKEASGSLDAVGEILANVDDSFLLYSGDDSLSLPMYSLGGRGVITTTGNVAPKLMSSIYAQFRQGDTEDAQEAHFKLLPLFNSLFAETNPAPVKYALSRMGLMRNELRLPMVPVAPETEARLDQALIALNLP